MPSTRKSELTAKQLQALKDEAALHRRIVRFYQRHNATDFSAISPKGEKVDYKHSSYLKHPVRKAPKESMSLRAVEEYIDLGIALKTQDWEGAKKSYFFLRRLTD